jgi:nitronate monooxygenase
MLPTALTEMFGLEHPIVLAPMGGVSGGRLAAAVSNAGGLGLVGGGYGDPAWLRTELSRIKEETSRPWGVGLITWAVDTGVVELVLGYRPHALMLSFGDPRPHGVVIKAAGCKLICQVQDLYGAQLAVEAGADIIVAQGTEAGGHGGGRSTLPLVPAVADVVAPMPVVAAGGIADGRGLAAVLMLGAHGALIGTRFYASVEALGHDHAKRRIVLAHGDEAGRTTVFDIVRELAWPAPYTGRGLRNRFIERWHGRERELSAALDVERGPYQTATREGDIDTAVVWAGEAVDLILSVERAATLVQRISAQAEQQLILGANLAQSHACASTRECNAGSPHPTA